jgi:hypothetical protein
MNAELREHYRNGDDADETDGRTEDDVHDSSLLANALNACASAGDPDYTQFGPAESWQNCTGEAKDKFNG